MSRMVTGLHHLTALAGDPQANHDFYTGTLGMRLIKVTVNFDDPSVYHLYFGDGAGTPGTVITSFPYGRALPARRGAGEATSVTLLVPEGSLARWHARLPEAREATAFGKRQLRVLDPDGMEVRLEEAPEGVRVPWPGMPLPVEDTIVRMGSIELAPGPLRTIGAHADTGSLLRTMGMTETAREGATVRYAVGDAFVDVVQDETLLALRQSAGSIHHIAFRIADDEAQAAALESLHAGGVATSDVRDRDYFHSIYFREPGGVLFEIATKGPGFTIDETFETLGDELRVPERYQGRIEAIRENLGPLDRRRG